MHKDLFTHKIDAFLIESPVNRFYFTDYATSFGYLTVTKQGSVFYTDPRYFEEARTALGGVTVKSVTSTSAFSVIASDLKNAGVVTIGYEDDFSTVAAFKNFKKAFGEFTLKPASDILKSLRIVKTKEQTERIAAAQRIAEKVFDKVAHTIRPGVTEKEVRARLIIETLEAGGDGVAFEPIVAFGANTAVPHHSPGSREFKKGDLVLIDYGVRLNGYQSDMTRSFFLSEPDEEDENIQKLVAVFGVVLAAQSYVLKHLKSGMTCREADSLAREYLRANGYDQEFGHSLGHGVGLEVHERPNVRESSDEVLICGMVLTVEPGVYIPGVGGIRIEDMVAVTEEGIINLTETPKKLVL